MIGQTLHPSISRPFVISLPGNIQKTFFSRVVIQKHLVEGFRQTNAEVLKLENMDTGQFKNTIEYMKRNSLPIGDILLLNKNGQGIELSYRDLKFGKYHNKIKGFLK